MEETIGGSIVIGELAKGCKLCMKGAKMVLFITGLCTANCFYCPLSKERKNRDVIFADEVKVNDIREALREAEYIEAEGTGITGGDPLIVFTRTIKAIKILKEHFGSSHHIHLYTNAMLLTIEKALKLKEVGLDEIRIHPTREEDWRKIKIAKQAGLKVGIEIPVIPGTFNSLKRKLKLAEKLKVDFININELEFTPSNAMNLKIRGFKLKRTSLTAVEGSEEEALKVLNWALSNTNLNIHYCPSRLKDSVQLKNRLRRRALKVAKKYEKITDEGLLVKGIIEYEGNLIKLANEIKEKLGVMNDLIEININKRRIEVSPEIALMLNSIKLPRKAKVFLIKEYPTEDRFEVFRIPLN